MWCVNVLYSRSTRGWHVHLGLNSSEIQKQTRAETDKYINQIYYQTESQAKSHLGIKNRIMHSVGWKLHGQTQRGFTHEISNKYSSTQLITNIFFEIVNVKRFPSSTAAPSWVNPGVPEVLEQRAWDLNYTVKSTSALCPGDEWRAVCEQFHLLNDSFWPEWRWRREKVGVFVQKLHLKPESV